VHQQHSRGTNYIYSVTEMNFFDKCVTAHKKFKTECWVDHSDKSVTGKSYDIKKKAHQQDFATNLLQLQ
jgi:hypothetical protein